MKRMLLAGAMAGLSMLLAACGDEDGDDAAATDPPVATEAGTAPTTAAATTAGGSEPATSDGPSRIVSLSPTHTEILFAIGAGDQVIAVDDQSNYPPEAEAVMTDLSGFEPNVEAIASYDPDLVVSSSSDPALVDGLAALDIEMWDGPAARTLDDTYAQIEELGDITGHEEEAT